jgi:hypothetical protein
MGMGDHIVHNGMIRKIVEEYPNYQIYVGAKNHNYNNVKYMFRDNSQIVVINTYDDEGLGNLIQTGHFDKIISSHFGDGNPYHYETYFDDAFYKLVGMNPKIKNEYFYIERDTEMENKVFDELITSKGIDDYLFLHEKHEQLIRINRNKLESNLPIITPETKYGIFELLKVIERAKSVHIVCSSFASLMMCKKYNKNVIVHTYCDRDFIAPYIKKHGIEVFSNCHVD